MGKINKTNNYTEFYYHFFRNALVFSLPLLVISALILSIPHSSADNSSLDSVMLSIPTTCTLSTTIDSKHSISTLGGTYTEDIGETTMKTICNDANGFSIYAIGASRSNEGSTVLASSLGEDYDIATGTATSGNTSNWAMKLATDSSAVYPITLESGFNTNNYVSVPGTWTKVAHRTSGTDTATEAEAITGASLSTTYAAYITPAQPAGTYIGQVKYILLHPNTNENFMTLEMAFDHYIGPEHKIPLENSSDPNTPTYYRMQDMTNQICQAATVMGGGAQMQLIDDRTNLDGKKRLYWVAKLADGNCWMTQNLDLDLIANHTYTHSDTDLGWHPNSFDANATWTLTGGPSTIGWDDTSGSFPGWQDSNTLPYSADPGDKYYYTSNSTAKDTAYDSLTVCMDAGHVDCEHYGAGNYYNWTAAIAKNSSGSSSSTTSVCPAGWRLPSKKANDFGNLLVQYRIIETNESLQYLDGGFNNIRNFPLYFTESGETYSGTIHSAAGYGAYWTGTHMVGSYSYYLDYNKQNIISSDPMAVYGGKNYGRSLRCLAR